MHNIGLLLSVIIIYQCMWYGCQCVQDEHFPCSCNYLSMGIRVNCAGLGLTKLPSGIPENTTELNLDNNNIVNIEESSLLRLHRLEKISLNSNKLTTLPKFPKNIHIVSAENNMIESIDGAFASLPRLRSIFLKSNPVKVLRNTTFQNTQLENIEIGGGLHVIEPFTFAGLPHLITITIEGDGLNELQENSFFLTGKLVTTITITDRFLSKLSPGTFRIPPNSLIYLQGCNLTTIPERVITASYVRVLRLGRNKISNIHPKAFIELRTIDTISVNHNLLTTIPSALKTLNCIQVMDLSSNRISSLGPDPVLKYSPRHIYLDFNQIEKISINNFKELPSLKGIVLSQNRISYIEDESFSGTNVTVIYLIGNKLKNITNGTFRNGLIEYVYLFDNDLIWIEDNTFSYMAQNSQVYIKCDHLKDLPLTKSGHISCVKNTTEILFEKFTAEQIRMGKVCNGTRCRLCKQGYFQSTYAFTCVPCPPGGFFIDVLGKTGDGNYANNCKRCPHGSFSPTAGAGSVADCQTCPSGTNTSELANLNACECLDKFYRIDRYGECVPCPKGTDCSNGFQQLQPGYWWSWDFPDYLGSFKNYSIFTTQMISNIFNVNNPDELKLTKYVGLLPAVHKCKRSKSCSGDGINVTCSEGYKEWMCAACNDGYYELFNQCYKCQRTWIIVLVFAAVVFIFICIGYIVWRIDKRKNITHMVSFFTHMKIAITFYQILGILSEVNEIHWPENFQSVGESLQYLDIVRYVNVLSPKCIFHEFWNAYTLLYIAIGTPFIIVLITSTIFLFVHIIYKYKGDHSGYYLKDKCLSITLMLMYLTYANTCSNIMAVGPWSIRTFNVTANGNYTRKFLTSDYSIDLDAGGGSDYDMNKKIMYASLLYVVGFPLFLVLVLYWKYKRNQNDDVEGPETVRLSFFCRQYSKRFWYWEAVDMYNKAILSFIANFKDDEASNMSYSLFVTVILIGLHLYLEPMKAKSDQKFQLLTLMFVIVNLSIGAVVDTDGILYAEDDTVALFHDITPFILLLINSSILVVVFVDLLMKVKESICEESRHQNKAENEISSPRYVLLNAADCRPSYEEN